MVPRSSIDPFRTAVPFWGQTSQMSSSLSPKQDCGPKGVKVPSPTVVIYCAGSICATAVDQADSCWSHRAGQHELLLVINCKSYNPFSTAVPFRGASSLISSSLPPQRDCSPKRVNTRRYMQILRVPPSNIGYSI